MFNIRQLFVGMLVCLALPNALAQTVITGKGSTFVLNYDPVYDSTMQSIINNAALFWADSVRSTVPITVNVNAVNLSCNYSYNSFVDTQPPAAAINFPNAPLANTYYPIALANALAGVDLQPATADIELNLNKKMVTNFFCPHWYLGYDDNYSFLEFSLYFETMQDIAHGLGLIPLGNLMTGQKLNGYNDVYWTKLKSEKSNTMLTDLTDQQARDVARDSLNLAFKGEKSWAAAENITYSRTSDAILLFSRSYESRALTGSHVHESTGPLQLMTIDLRGAIPQTDVALAMLEDLGWKSTRNAEPVIQSQQTININEDTSYALSLADLIVIDEDTAALSVQFQSGSNYTLNGNTLTPTANFFGTLTVPVSVSDAEYTSAVFNLEITVLPVNDLPTITGQQPLTLNEDNQLSLSPSQFTISDIDSSSFTLQIGSGSHYSVTGSTLIPDANFNGTLTVPVRAHDGNGLSNTFNATITVNSINDAPVISARNNLSIAEDTSITLSTSMLTIADVDSNQFSLTVAAGSHYTVSGLTIIPEANFYGELTVPVSVSDGAASSSVFNLRVTVTPINDAPLISAQQALTTLEDQSISLSLNLFTITDIDSSNFTLAILPGENYSVNGMQVTPNANFSGTLVVPVNVNDGQANSPLFNAVVVVTEVNDAPVINGQTVVKIEEEAPFVLTPALLNITDVDSALFTLSAAPGNHYSLSGNTLTPATNFNGFLTVVVSVSDGEASSNSFALVIEVMPTNDAPVVTGQTAITIDEDSTLALTPSLLTFVDVDSNEFQLKASAGDHYQIIGQQLVPETNFFGTLNVPMQISDGIELSNIFPVTITVNPVNDVPVITDQKALVIDEETPLSLTLSTFTITDVDSTVFTLQLLNGEHYTLAGNTTTPDDEYSGTLLVPVQVSDGLNTSATFITTITVNAVNDAPIITNQQIITIDEDSTLPLALTLLSITDSDSTQFQLLAQSGDNYSINNNQLTPNANYAGILSVPVQVTDGTATSNIWLLNVAVNAVNDAPIIESIAAQTIFEDSSLFVSKSILTINDPDDSEFLIEIERGDHYRVAGNEIIPDANWFGELNIGLTINDGKADSNTATLNLTVSELNDLPEFTTTTLPHGQIYRPWQASLSATDIDGDNLTFAFTKAPNWLTITEEGELNAFPTENMIGDHELEISVSDGRAMLSETFTLTILNDATASNIGVSLAVERTIWSTDGWVPVTLTATNAGPKDSVDATVVINFPAQWTTQDNRCQVSLNHCALVLTEQTSFIFSVRQTTPGSADLTATMSHEGFETDTSNDQAQLTLTFSDALPTSPQYTVPAFGQGTVRAIGLANVQGGRWPEIMFANGATEASTVYKFEKSLFRPDLHSHLGDASNSYAMALFDIDNDGDIDWVLANGQGEANTVYLNDGQGFFTLTDALGHYDSRAVAYGDIDGDGDQDLVFANNEDPNTLYLNNGDGTFTLHQEFPAQRSRAVIVYDFNRDGKADILFANRGWRNRIYFSRVVAVTARTLLRSTTSPTQTTLDGFDNVDFGQADDLTSRALLADLDGDGIASDIVMVNEANDNQSASLQLFAVDDQGNSQLISATNTGTVADMSIGDYDGDGKDDIAVLRPGGAMEVMSNTGGVLNTIEVMDTDGADTILLVDVDGSGKADVISANNRNQSSRLDFIGDVVDNEDTIETEGDTVVNLPVTPRPASVSNSSRNSGAGIPIILLPLLWLLRRKQG